MEKNESIERFTEGLEKAADRARQLSKAQKNPMWDVVASGLDGMASSGRAMFFAKALSRNHALSLLDARESRMKRE